MHCVGASTRLPLERPTTRLTGVPGTTLPCAWPRTTLKTGGPICRNPQTGNPRSVNRWGVVALLVLSAALVAASLDVASSVRSLLLAAMVMGVLVGPIIRCLGTPSLKLHDSRAERP